MNNTELVRTLMTALDAGDIAKAGGLLADDFQISGPFPEPMSKEQWLGMHSTLKAAFPAPWWCMGAKKEGCQVY